MLTPTPKILVAEAGGFSAEAVAVLRQVGEVVLADLDRQGLLSAVRDTDLLIVRLRHHIDAEVMAAAQHLKVIATPTTGLNHIDVLEATKRNIKVLSLRGETQFLRDVRATAEHTMSLIFALLRQVPLAVRHVQGGGWNRDLFKGRELCGKTIGIIGYGRLGRIVARYLKAFDTRVLTSDPYVEATVVEPNVTLVPLPQLLQEADLVSLHVNLCDETRDFFGRQHFAMMKVGAWFINTSRGELVDEEALLGALGSGRLSGAAVDVLSDERSSGMADHPLVHYTRTHDNLIITPHIGGCTLESMEKTEVFLAEAIRATYLTPNSLSYGTPCHSPRA
jgi:D-3-phosphoglycerate dehydrogenase / 2-oxoglutarate reductase